MRRAFLQKINQYHWHDWFAWYPVVVENSDVKAIVWFESVRRIRCSNLHGSWWEYDLIS